MSAALQSFADDIRARARALGFDAVGITDPDAIPAASTRLTEFLEQSRHGDMEWMETRAEERARPTTLWPGVRSIIMLGLNYGPSDDPLESLHRASCGAISVYARNRDYHDIVKSKLKTLGRSIASDFDCEIKVFVDTAPVMEKPLAESAGIGWQGKHTNLVSRRFGSWLFLGAIFTNLALEADKPEGDHCGACRRCLDICPTAAFPAPYQLDARRCISYLTIEHKGSIPREFRAAIGNRIYGCDDCLAVCPWNKFASQAREQKLKARDDLIAPDLGALAALDDAAFRKFFSGSPVKRIGRDRFVRNVLIAIGNSGDQAFAAIAERLTQDASPLVRAAAIWAASHLLSPRAYERLQHENAGAESDPDVLEEWRLGA